MARIFLTLSCAQVHSSLFSQDGIVVGAVGAYDWNGGVLKETRQGKVVPPKSSYADEFPEELKNHGAYLGELQLPGRRTGTQKEDDGRDRVQRCRGEEVCRAAAADKCCIFHPHRAVL